MKKLFTLTLIALSTTVMAQSKMLDVSLKEDTAYYWVQIPDNYNYTRVRYKKLDTVEIYMLIDTIGCSKCPINPKWYSGLMVTYMGEPKIYLYNKKRRVKNETIFTRVKHLQ